MTRCSDWGGSGQTDSFCRGDKYIIAPSQHKPFRPNPLDGFTRKTLQNVQATEILYHINTHVVLLTSTRTGTSSLSSYSTILNLNSVRNLNIPQFTRFQVHEQSTVHHSHERIET